MKKSVSLILITLLLAVSFVIADNGNETATQDPIDLAYSCLREKIDDAGCDRLPIESKIFSVLATGKCKNELIADSQNDECWPSGGCNIKSTAQAILALDKTSSDTEKAREWLLKQSGTPEDMMWYLQIDSNKETNCRIKYDESEYSTGIRADKTIISGAGACLTIETGRPWWLKISSNCLDKEFEISCDEGFTTSLLFRREGSLVYYVSENTHSSSADGMTKEKINSLCFKQGGRCDYEGTLWAALVLNYVGEATNSYLSYLVALAGDNSEHLPESFLYGITGYADFRINLLGKQRANQYWEDSGRRYYDTPVALMNLADEPLEKTNTKNWLLKIQRGDGCWDGGNILSNAFILYSIWPKRVEVSDVSDSDTVDCEQDGNFYCMSRIDCPADKILSNTYQCSGTQVCCEVQKQIPTCSELEGEICNPQQTRCVGGDFMEASGLSSGERCCVNGYCSEPAPIPECEIRGGTCLSFCGSSEKEEDYECDSGVCCIPVTQKEGGLGWLWIVILLILIGLVVLGIIFRERLRPFWFKLKSKFPWRGGKSGENSGTFSSGPRRPPGAPGITNPSSTIPYRGFPQKRILPVSRKPLEKRKGLSKEHDEILKKLKEMGKQ
jgi:hypothetical protein